MRHTAIFTLILCTAAAVAVSCSDDIDSPDAVGNSIFIPNTADEANYTEMEFDGEWNLENPTSWLTVSPKSGSAGKTRLRLTALDTNPEMIERVGNFTVDIGGKLTKYYVIQDAVPGIDAAPVIIAGSGEESRQITVGSNTSYEVSSDDDWISIGEIEFTDSILLEDGHTYSRFKMSRINIGTAANTGGIRNGSITLSGDSGIHKNVTVTQIPQMSVIEGKELHRRSVILKFTGTWCGNCPPMSEGIHEAIDKYPDDIVTMSMYQNSGDLSYSDVDNLAEFFAIYGYPAGIFNRYAYVNNTSAAECADNLIELAKEAEEELPASTAIGGLAAAAQDCVILTASIASTDGGTYYVSAYLLEDGITAPQNGASADYVHDHIVRASCFEFPGEQYEILAGETVEIPIEIPVPGTVQDPSKLSILIFTAKDGSFIGSVGNLIEYRDYGFIIDNAAVLYPDGNLLEFAYNN